MVANLLHNRFYGYINHKGENCLATLVVVRAFQDSGRTVFDGLRFQIEHISVEAPFWECPGIVQLGECHIVLHMLLFRISCRL